MDIKNKKQKVFRLVLALVSCSFAVAPLVVSSVASAEAPGYSADLQSLIAPLVKAAAPDSNDATVIPTGKLPDIAAYSKIIDIKSFLGKPVRIPIPSDNPDKVPGGDLDYVIVYPPQFYLNKKTGKVVSFPVKSVYLASGKSISKEKQQEVQTNLENYINYCFCNQDKVLVDLKDALRQQAQTPKPRSYLDGIFRIFNVVHAEDTTTAGDTASSDAITDQDIQTLLDSNDPQMKQMLMLLLLNLLMSQKMADASNVDKQTCLDNGGEWVNNQCSLNQNSNDDSDQQAACEDSGGTWGSVSSSRSLCLSRCGKTDDKCQGSGLSDFEDSEGIIINSGDTAEINGCKCPEGQCASAEGKCQDDETQSGDEDEDNVPNGQDKCPKSSPDGSGTVNMNSSSGYMGCTCSQIQAMGGYQQQTTCPGNSCDGPYMVTYQQQSSTACSNGNITQGQCVAQRQQDQTCNQIYQDQMNQQAQKNQQDQQKQQDLQKMLQDLMKGGQKGGDQGGGQGGGKGGGQGGGGCPPGGQSPQGAQEPPPAGAPKPGATEAPAATKEIMESPSPYDYDRNSISIDGKTETSTAPDGSKVVYNGDTGMAEFYNKNGALEQRAAYTENYLPSGDRYIDIQNPAENRITRLFDNGEGGTNLRAHYYQDENGNWRVQEAFTNPKTGESVVTLDKPIKDYVDPIGAPLPNPPQVPQPTTKSTEAILAQDTEGGAPVRTADATSLDILGGQDSGKPISTEGSSVDSSAPQIVGNNEGVGPIYGTVGGVETLQNLGATDQEIQSLYATDQAENARNLYGPPSSVWDSSMANAGVTGQNPAVNPSGVPAGPEVPYTPGGMGIEPGSGGSSGLEGFDPYSEVTGPAGIGSESDWSGYDFNGVDFGGPDGGDTPGNSETGGPEGSDDYAPSD